jgi:transposase
MRAYSIDLRERIVSSVQAGKSKSEVARLFDVNVSTVKRYLARVEQGTLAPRTSPGRPRRIPTAEQPNLVIQLEASPDATLEEHCTAWEESHGVRLSVATMFRSIARANYTLKSKR